MTIWLFTAVSSTRRMYTFLLLLTLLYNRGPITSEDDSSKELSSADDEIVLAASNNEFAFKLQKTLSGNTFWSPMSVFTAMGMLYIGARGTTAREISQALSYDIAGLNHYNISTQFRRLLHSYVGDKHHRSIEIANALISRKGSPILEEYKADLDYYYDAVIKEMDFAKSEEALDEINRWVSNKTRGNIPRLLDSLDEDANLVLLNTIYFKGLWKTQFTLLSSTEDLKFYNNGTTPVSVSFMYQLNHLLYGDFPEYSLLALKLPYQGDRFSMIVLLPYQNNGLWEVESDLTWNALNSIVSRLRTKLVSLTFPKFSLKYKRELKDNLAKLGIKSAFTSSATFSGIDINNNLEVSRVIHQAVVEVNEAGTKASASTAVESRSRSLNSAQLNFLVDHPFLFFIMDDATGMIVFSGRVIVL